MRFAVSAAWHSRATRYSSCGLTLAGVDGPPVWRQVVIPAGYTLDRVHGVIQAAMGWQNSHLHMFRIACRKTALLIWTTSLRRSTKSSSGSVIW